MKFLISLLLKLKSVNGLFRIVGEDDGGELFTPEQYEEYKKKVLPMVRASKQANKQTNKQTNKQNVKHKTYKKPSMFQN